jgi:hypothetical protein
MPWLAHPADNLLEFYRPRLAFVNDQLDQIAADFRSPHVPAIRVSIA